MSYLESRRNYITATCCIDPGQRVLVNDGALSVPLGDLPLRLLECLMSRPNTIVSYETISQEVWNDLNHTPVHIAQLMHRIKRLCSDIGVQDEELNKSFETIRRQGIRFNTTSTGIESDIDNIRLREKTKSEIDCIYYLSQTCYIILDQRVLVSRDKRIVILSELPWRLLRCLLQRHGVTIPYDDISFAIWGDRTHGTHDITVVLVRLRKYFVEIDVNTEDIKRTFIHYRGKGIQYIPQ